MQRLNNIGIFKKLILAFAVSAVLTALLGAFSVVRLHELSVKITDMNETWMPSIRSLLTMKSYLLEFRTYEIQFINAKDEAKQADYVERMKKTRGEFERVNAEYAKRISSVAEKNLYEDFAKTVTAYMGENGKILKAMADKDVVAAVTVLNSESLKLRRQTADAIDNVVKYNVDGAKQTVKETNDAYRAALDWIIGGAGIAALAALLFGWLIARSITHPLRVAVEMAGRVAEGDLTSAIEATGKDETGQLLAALKAMNGNLMKLIGGVRANADTISLASREIAAGNADLSQRTEEQASSLEETASSVEELTGTVRQNAENAQQANQLAAGASAVAVKGGQVVSQVVNTMASINESSKKIADIISVIDGIAFQTNILALNAAVEAARAGEQGRGFAVVATEVRNLAQRSAAAAKEIKELISDSVHKVENGSKLVDEAGRTMQEIVGSVKRVTDIMSEITAASQEQSTGIEQVNQAITQMDQATQQNAALVEEAAAAAESMQEQAQALTQAVAVFKLAQGMPLNALPVGVRSEKPSANVSRLPAREVKTAARNVAPARARKVAGSDAQAAEWQEF